MKIWIEDTKTTAYRLVKLNCEKHSNYEYLGDLDDEDLKEFLVSIKEDIDVVKNIKLLHYFGYLHLFVTTKSRR